MKTINNANVCLNGKGSGHIRSFRALPKARVIVLCVADYTVMKSIVEKPKQEGAKVETYTNIEKIHVTSALFDLPNISCRPA